MPARTKLLVHARRISSLFQNALDSGPEGTLEGKFGAEHDDFVHHSCGFYLLGSFAYLESESGEYSWNKPSVGSTDFDTFCRSYPAQPHMNYEQRGVSKARMQMLADLRNAIAHCNGDLSRIRRAKSADVVSEAVAANVPGVDVLQVHVRLRAPFLEYTRLACLAVRNYHGEY